MPTAREVAMQKSRWILSVTAALVAAAIPAAAGEAPCRTRARMQWIDVLDVAPFAFRTAADEALRILRERGVCAEVVRASASSVRSKGEIGIILLRAMPGSATGRRVLGATKKQPLANAVWIYFDEVAATLGLGGRPTESWDVRERLLAGRALGRVLAHEIVHVLLPGRPHDLEGLMARSFGPRELMASTFPQGGPELTAPSPLPH
jgi:hypothetical protein